MRTEREWYLHLIHSFLGVGSENETVVSKQGHVVETHELMAIALRQVQKKHLCHLHRIKKACGGGTGRRDQRVSDNGNLQA